MSGNLKIGCVSLVQVPFDDRLVGIKSPQRGYILPGGKWNGKSETFRQAAERELREETGLIATDSSYLFGGAGVSKNTFVYTFLTNVKSVVEGFETHEGVCEFVTWDQLMVGKYAAYYDILKEIYESKFPAQLNIPSPAPNPFYPTYGRKD